MHAKHSLTIDAQPGMHIDDAEADRAAPQRSIVRETMVVRLKFELAQVIALSPSLSHNRRLLIRPCHLSHYAAGLRRYERTLHSALVRTSHCQ